VKFGSDVPKSIVAHPIACVLIIEHGMFGMV